MKAQIKNNFILIPRNKYLTVEKHCKRHNIKEKEIAELEQNKKIEIFKDDLTGLELVEQKQLIITQFDNSEPPNFSIDFNSFDMQLIIEDYFQKYRNELHKSRQEIGKMQIQLENSQSITTNLTNEVQDAKSLILELQQENENFKSSRTTYQIQSEQLKQAVELNEATITSQNEEIFNLNKAIELNQQTIADLENDKERNQQTINELKEEKRSLTNQVFSQEYQLQNYEKALDNLHKTKTLEFNQEMLKQMAMLSSEIKNLKSEPETEHEPENRKHRNNKKVSVLAD